MILFLFLGFTFQLLAQDRVDFGPEVQAYPTGVIPGIRIEYKNWNVRLGFQWINHRDLGVQDDEQGNGYGFSLGYKTNLSNKFNLLFRNDFWWNSIDWVNENPSATGETEIFVLQPTAVLEYRKGIISDRLIPSLGFGWEWNAKTDGEATGEGAILLIGLYYRL